MRLQRGQPRDRKRGIYNQVMFCFYMDVKITLASIISNQEVKLTYTHKDKNKQDTRCEQCMVIEKHIFLATPTHRHG